MVDLPGLPPNLSLRLLTSVADAGEFMTWLSQRREILGFDTETTGLSPERDRVRLIQFGDLKTGWAIPWERWGGVGMEALAKYDGPLVGHNSKFDVRQLCVDMRTSVADWPWHRTHDTLTAAHLLDPQRPVGLKPLSARYIDPKAEAGQRLLSAAMHDHKWDWATVPIDFQSYWAYAALDPVLTCYLWKEFSPTVMTTYRKVYDLELGALRLLAEMEERGTRIDTAYCELKITQLRQGIRAQSIWLRDQHGIENPNSNAQIIAALQKLDVPLTKLTLGGKISLDKEVLQHLDHPIARSVLNVRKAEKMIGPYFSNFIEMHDDNDRLHCSIRPLGTRTGRMSITEPALQTLPRKDPTVRDAFIPSEGKVLITCDYSQIEARLTAHFSKDAGLINAFRGSEDFFCVIASSIFGEPISKKDPRRQLTKNTIYGKIYGAGAAKMAITAGVPVPEMERVVAAFDDRFPGVRTMQRSIESLAAGRGDPAWIRTPYGRRLLADEHKAYTLTNYLIQGHAAEILKQKIIELDAALPPDAYMLLPVHDEMVFEVPADQVEETRRIIEDTMTDLTNYAVPLTVESEVLTERWGSKYR